MALHIAWSLKRMMVSCTGRKMTLAVIFNCRSQDVFSNKVQIILNEHPLSIPRYILLALMRLQQPNPTHFVEVCS